MMLSMLLKQSRGFIVGFWCVNIARFEQTINVPGKYVTLCILMLYEYY
jgi:hypothetical protein